MTTAPSILLRRKQELGRVKREDSPGSLNAPWEPAQQGDTSPALGHTLPRAQTTSQIQVPRPCASSDSTKPKSAQPLLLLTNHQGSGLEVGVKGTTAFAILQEDIAGLISR